MAVVLVVDFILTGSGGGGSSYVSGYLGCNSLDPSSTINNLIHTNSEIHYSNKIFSDIIIKTGVNMGNGYCTISTLDEF